MKLLLLFVLGLVGCNTPIQPPVPIIPQSHPKPPPRSTLLETTSPVYVAPIILQTLLHQKRVAIIIELKVPNVSNGLSKEQQIKNRQDAVINALVGEFIIKRRYSSLFALAGSISKHGIDILRHNPNVARISNDSINTINNAH